MKFGTTRDRSDVKKHFGFIDASEVNICRKIINREKFTEAEALSYGFK